MITKILLGISLFSLPYFYVLNSNFFIRQSDNYQNIPVVVQPTPLEKSVSNGSDIYVDFCVQCHMANGKGDGKNFPPLDGSDWLKKKRSQIIHVVKYGQSGAIIVNNKKYNNTMPPPSGLSNQEIADVINYIQNSWSNKNKKIVTAAEVALVKP